MNTLALDLISLMVRPLWDFALFGELTSGVPFRPWMTFHFLVHLNDSTLRLEGDLSKFMS